jgi:hypothetical protein
MAQAHEEKERFYFKDFKSGSLCRVFGIRSSLSFLESPSLASCAIPSIHYNLKVLEHSAVNFVLSIWTLLHCVVLRMIKCTALVAAEVDFFWATVLA